MRVNHYLLAITALVVLLDAERALAWGPAMHTELANSVLGHLGVLPAAVAAILAKNKMSFLFGNVAADVVFAKRLSRVKRFCHHWSTAFDVLRGARGHRSRAFALGYLSHLAADTVAHNKYVPHQVMISDQNASLGHFYWELRADAVADEQTRQLLKDVIRADHNVHHQLLKKHITGTFLPYGMNKAVFRAMNSLWSGRGIRRSLDAWARYSSEGLDDGLLDGYRAECLDRMLAVLKDGQNSSVLREDPSGTTAFMRLRVRRRERRRLEWWGLAVDRHLREASVGLEPNAHSPTHRRSSKESHI